MKILVCGDMHFRGERGYAQYIEDGRRSEVLTTLNFISGLGRESDAVVFMGDNLDSKNNTSVVIKEFVSFLESFAPKPVYIIAGNHTKSASGHAAEDFLKEIEGKHWKVFTNEIGIEVLADGTKLTFCPYFYKNEFGIDSNEEAAQHLMDLLPKQEHKVDYLFAHHGVTGSKVRHMMVDTFNEIVLPAEELANRFKRSFFGHIHQSQTLLDGKIIGTGSVFCDEAGEVSKSVWTLDTEANTVTEHVLPSRGIYSLNDPSIESLDLIEKHNIIKVVLTQRLDAPAIEALKTKLRTFSAYVLLENYPNERRKLVHNEKTNALDFSIEELLEIYAKQNDIKLPNLIKGWGILKETI